MACTLSYQPTLPSHVVSNLNFAINLYSELVLPLSPIYSCRDKGLDWMYTASQCTSWGLHLGLITWNPMLFLYCCRELQITTVYSYFIRSFICLPPSLSCSDCFGPCFHPIWQELQPKILFYFYPFSAPYFQLPFYPLNVKLIKQLFCLKFG